jgi:hypothetical protein
LYVVKPFRSKVSRTSTWFTILKNTFNTMKYNKIYEDSMQNQKQFGQ